MAAYLITAGDIILPAYGDNRPVIVRDVKNDEHPEHKDIVIISYFTSDGEQAQYAIGRQTKVATRKLLPGEVYHSKRLYQD